MIEGDREDRHGPETLHIGTELAIPRRGAGFVAARLESVIGCCLHATPSGLPTCSRQTSTRLILESRYPWSRAQNLAHGSGQIVSLMGDFGDCRGHTS